MSRFNTGNPIGSISEEDAYDNMACLDQAMNSTDPTWRDRFNVEKPTIDAALKSAGFMPTGFDFVTGGTLQPGDRNKAVYNPAPNGDNNWYRWNGVFPKEIAANSQPNPKDENNWVPVSIKTGVVEREALRRTYLEAGYNLVDGSFEQGGVLVNSNDVLLQERSGKVFSGPAGVVVAGTNPFIDSTFTNVTGALLRGDLSAPGGADIVGFQQTGPGSVPRTSQDKMREIVSIKDFGAVCDGVTDDSIAFEAFVRYLATNGGHGILPAGRIGLSSRTYNAATLGSKPFSIKGAGKRATVLYNVSKTNYGHLVAWSGFEGGMMLSDFSVDAGRDRMTTPPDSGNGAMVAINCQYMLVENVLWENFTAVGFMSYNDHPTNPTKTYHHLHVRSCEADGKTYWRPGQGSGPNATFGSGILIADINDSTIINCHTRWTSQYSIEYKNSCSRTIIAHCSITDAYNGLYYGGNSELKDERYVKDSIITNCILTRVKNPLWLGTADRNVVTNIVIDNRGVESTMCVVIRDGHHNVVRGIKVYGRTTYLMDIRGESSFNTIEFDYIEDDDSMTVHGGYINADSPNNTVIYPETYKSNAEFIHFSARKSVDAIFIDKRKGTVINTTNDGRRSFKQYGAITVDALPLSSTWYGDAYLQGGGKDYSRHSVSDGNYYYDRYYKMGQNGYAPAFVRATLTTSPDYRIYLQTDNQSSSQMNFTFTTDRFFCAGDGIASCGAPTARWNVMFAAQGTINTSDAREKTSPLAIDNAILDAWGDVQLVTFQWLNSIRAKGEEFARWHFGVIAQQVRDAFVARGLDGTRYGLLCYDEWEDEFEPIIEIRKNEDSGELEEHPTGEMKLVLAAGNRWGIRPDQCLFLEAAYQRRRCDRIEARLSAAGL